MKAVNQLTTLPTAAEWEAEILSWGSNNNTEGAFASPLKLPMAGRRSYNYGGALLDVGSLGRYWSSTVDDTYASYLFFGSSDAGMGRNRRAYGFSVRCLKE